MMDPKTVEYLLAVQKQMKTIAKSIEPALTLRKQLEQISRSRIEEFERIRRQSRSVAATIERFQQNTRVISDAIRTLHLQTRSIGNVLAHLHNQAQSYAKALEHIKEVSKGLSLKLNPLTFGEAYEEVLNRYYRAAETAVPDPIEIVVNKVEDQVRKVPSGPLSLEFYITLVITLFVFVLSQISSIKSEKRIAAKIEELAEYVSNSLVELRSYEDEYTFYIVEKPVNLRAGPTTESEILSVLHPCLKVRLMERQANWIKVEYFDYIENTNKSGWVYKKYLRILNLKIPKKEK